MINYCHFNWEETEIHGWDLNRELLVHKNPGITRKELEAALAQIEADKSSPPPVPSGSGAMDVDTDQDEGDQAPENEGEGEGEGEGGSQVNP